MNTFYIFLAVSFPSLPPSSIPQSSSILPALSVPTPLLFFFTLYLPLLCALPSLPSPSLGPPARSFPRTDCSQHRPPDWLMGIKGTVPLPSTWLDSSSATTLSSFPTLLRLPTVLAAHTDTHIAAHMYTQQWIQRHTNTRCWQNIWHTHIYRLSCLLNQVGAAGCTLHDSSLIRVTNSAWLQIHQSTQAMKKTLDPCLQTASTVWTKQAFSFTISERDTLQAQQTWKTQSKQLQSSWSR